MGRTLAKGIVAAACLCALRAAGERFGRPGPDRLAVQARDRLEPVQAGDGHDPDLADGRGARRRPAERRRASRRPTASTSTRRSPTTRPRTRISRIDPEERSIALYQAARYSLRCRVFAPMYRQLTLSAILSGGSPTAEQAPARLQRRGQRLEELPAPVQRRPRRDPDRPLAGHLPAAPAGPRPRRQPQGHPQAPDLGAAAGWQRHRSRGRQRRRRLPARARVPEAQQIGCVVGFSTFNAPVPAEARFGRPGNVLDRSGPRAATSSAPTPRRSEAAAPCCAPSIRASRSRRGPRSAPAPRRSGSRARR